MTEAELTRLPPYPVFAVVDGERKRLDLGTASQLVIEVAPGVEVGIMISAVERFQGRVVLETPPFDLQPVSIDRGNVFRVQYGGANTLHVLIEGPRGGPPLPGPSGERAAAPPIDSSAAGDSSDSEKTDGDGMTDDDTQPKD